MNRKLVLPGAALLCVLLFIATCAKAPITGRRQFLLVTEAEEVQLGAEGYAEILETSELSDDEEAVAQLRTIGWRIADVTDEEDYEWEFNLIENDSIVNAFCLPGGKVDYGDTIENTIAKELREETELVCTGSRFLFYQDSLPEGPGKMHCLNLYFECTASGSVRLNEESSEHAWIGPDDLDRYEVVFGNGEGLRRYWR